MATASALAYISEKRFEQAAACAKKALAQNPRSAQALRFLAASLARLGDQDGASQAIREVLRIEPLLTTSRLRARLKFMQDALWDNMAEGLQLAGLPE